MMNPFKRPKEQADTDDEDFNFADVDSWMVQPGEGMHGQTPGDYTDWVGLVREILRARLDTLEDFLPDAIIQNEDLRKMVVMYVEMGKQQLHAPVNNRREEMERIKNDIAILNHFIEHKGLPELDEDMHFSLEMQEILDYLSISLSVAQTGNEDGEETEIDDALMQMVVDDRNAMKNHADRIYTSMQRDKGLGQFQDYGELKAKMRSAATSQQPNVGEITMMLPYFLSLAFTVCRATETNTRRAHAQATVSRQLDMRGHPDALKLMQAQNPGRPRSKQ